MQNTIIERNKPHTAYGLLSLLLALICPIVGLFISIADLINNSSRKPFFNALTVGYFFGCLAYWINPKLDIDLVRYFEDVVPYIGMRVSEFGEIATTSILPGKHLMFFLAGRTGDVHVLPFISTLICYTIIFFISFDYSHKLRFSPVQKANLAIFLLAFIPFLNFASNVRNVTAFSIALLAIYRDLIEGKGRRLTTLLLYIIPITIHISAFTIIAIRLIVPVVNNVNTALWKRIVITVLFLLGVFLLIYFAERYTHSYLGRYYHFVNDKSSRISSGETASDSTLAQFTRPSRILLRVFYEALASFVSYMLIRSRKFYILNPYETFCLIIAVIVVLCAVVPQAIYARYSYLMVSLCFPIMINRIRGSYIRFKTFLTFSVSGYVVIGLVYNIYRLHLSANVFEVFLNGSVRPFFLMFRNF